MHHRGPSHPPSHHIVKFALDRDALGVHGIVAPETVAVVEHDQERRQARQRRKIYRRLGVSESNHH